MYFWEVDETQEIYTASKYLPTNYFLLKKKNYFLLTKGKTVISEWKISGRHYLNQEAKHPQKKDRPKPRAFCPDALRRIHIFTAVTMSKMHNQMHSEETSGKTQTEEQSRKWLTCTPRRHQGHTRRGGVGVHSGLKSEKTWESAALDPGSVLDQGKRSNAGHYQTVDKIGIRTTD